MPLLKLENGVSVSYLSYPDERPSPSRPTVVLLSAFVQRVDVQFAPQLHDERFKGFNFVGIDVHGHGDTVGRENWDYVDNANDVVEALTALDVDKFFVLGTTHGGLTAQEITLRHPERVRGMVLVGSTSRPYGDAIASQCRDVLVPAWMSSTPPSDLAVQGPLLLTVGVAAKPAEASGSVFGDRAVGPTVLQGAERTAESVVGIELLSRIVDNFRVHTGEAKVMKPVEVMLNWPGSESRLRNVKVPVLVIHGLDDPFLPFERSKHIVSLLPEHPLTRLVEMDGKGSHVLNVVLDIIPEFNARLRGWLDEAIQAGL